MPEELGLDDWKLIREYSGLDMDEMELQSLAGTGGVEK